MSEPIEVSDNTFEKTVLQADRTVMVDFWAPWCGPCRRVAPIVEELSQEYEGRVNFAKLNVDDNPGSANQYGVRTIPTLLIFQEGKPMSQAVGVVSKAELKRHLDDALNGGGGNE